MQQSYNIADYSKNPKIDSRVLEVCAKAEAKYILTHQISSQSKSEFFSNMKELSKSNENYEPNNIYYNAQYNKYDNNDYYNNYNPSYNENLNTNGNSKFFQNNNNYVNSNRGYNYPQNYKPEVDENYNFNPNQSQQIPQFLSTEKLPFDSEDEPIKMSKDIMQNPKASYRSPFATRKSFENPNQKIKEQSSFRPISYRSPNLMVVNKNSSVSTKKVPKSVRINPHQSHISTKSRVDINKILLDAKTLIKKKKFLEAHTILKNEILLGVYHSDLFYLYGEVNRILQNYKEAEDYLLLSLNFEMHSPYAFYSLGLLYQEEKQYKYSNSFFKLFLQLINNDDAHYQLAKNYSLLKKYIKAGEEMTKAIELRKDCVDYYRFRAEIYKVIGLTEMAVDDEKMADIIIKTNYKINC